MTLLRSFQEATLFSLIVFLLVVSQIENAFAEEKNISSNTGLASIDFKAGHLMVSVEDHKFSAVMEAVAKKAGIKILLTLPTDEKLTITFDYLPLEIGLKKLFRGKDYVLVNHSNEEVVSSMSQPLLEVIVLGKLTSREINKTIKFDLEKQKENFTNSKQIKEITDIHEIKSLEEGILQALNQQGVFIEKEETINSQPGVGDISKVLRNNLQNFETHVIQQSHD